jgi:hypothetical protein
MWGPLELNEKIEQLFQLLFLNVYVSPLFWIFLPSFLGWTREWFFPAFQGCCYVLGMVSFIVCKLRRTKKIQDWSSEIVVVTGGSHGIGQRCCELLLEKGARVVIIDRMKPVLGL